MSTDRVASDDPHSQDPRSSSGGGGGRCRGCGFEAVSAETVAHHLFLDCPQHSVARARLRRRISKVVRWVGFVSFTGVVARSFLLLLKCHSWN